MKLFDRIKNLLNEVEMEEKKNTDAPVVEEKKNEEKPVVEEKKNEEKPVVKPVMANEEHMVQVGEEHMSVKDLREKYQALIAPKVEEPKKDAVEVEIKPEEKKNEDAPKPLEEQKKNEEKPEEPKKNSHFEALKNAPHTMHETRIDLSQDKVERGKARYGSSK
jgi:hypothetical protein